MKNLWVIYKSKPSYKRVLLRKVTWWLCHYRNCKWSAAIKFPQYFINVQLMPFGISKCNREIRFRLLNFELEIGW